MYICQNKFYIMTGKQVKLERVKLDLTQSELAKEIGISTSSLVNYEKGRTDNMQVRIINKIENYFKK